MLCSVRVSSGMCIGVVVSCESLFRADLMGDRQTVVFMEVSIHAFSFICRWRCRP